MTIPAIRPEEHADTAQINALVTSAFGRPDEADLVDRLRAEGDAVNSLVAVEAEEVVGHILFSRMTAPFPALGLAPVSVRPGRQGQGIGAALIRAGLARAEAEGWRAVFVLGDPAYYGRFGFSADLAQGFDCVYAGPYLMALALGGDLSATSGPVAYAPAFAGME